MVFWSALILMLITGAWPLCAQAQQVDLLLQQAREALAGGRLDQARGLYAQIPYPSPTWDAKLEDGVRLALLNGQGEQAWQAVQIAKRTLTHLTLGHYYEDLALTLGKICVLGDTKLPERSFKHLLDAYIYRNPSLFKPRRLLDSPFEGAEEGKRALALSRAKSPYLEDIAQTRLIPGQGCSSFSGRLQNRKEASRFEWQELLAWYDDFKRGEALTRLPGHEEVLMRLLELACVFNDKDLQQELLAKYKTYTAEGWLGIASVERRFLWQKMIDAGIFPPPPLPIDHPLTPLVEKITLGCDDTSAIYWFGLIEVKELPGSHQMPIIKHLLAINDIPQRPYLLLLKARNLYQTGQMTAALAQIRSLLIQDEAQGDIVIEQKSVDIAAAIFTEYQYDEQVLGAIQSAIPVGYWGRIMHDLYLEHALAGNAKGMAVIAKVVQRSKQHGALRLQKDENEMLTALATRNMARFDAVLRRWRGMRHLSGGNINFLLDLGAGSFALSEEQLAAVDAYFRRIAEVVHQFLQEGAQPLEKLRELMPIFDRKNLTGWSLGAETVRQGTVKAGVVHLQKTDLALPFTWSAPSNLPSKDLIAVPVSAGDRKWQIK